MNTYYISRSNSFDPKDRDIVIVYCITEATIGFLVNKVILIHCRRTPPYSGNRGTLKYMLYFITKHPHTHGLQHNMFVFRGYLTGLRIELVSALKKSLRLSDEELILSLPLLSSPSWYVR